MLSVRAAPEEVRYLGSSNGVEFAELVENVVNVTGSLGWAPPEVEPFTKLPAPNFPKNEPFLNHEAASLLISAYFEHWHMTFPILHRPSFIRVSEKILHEVDFYNKNVFDAFIFDVVLALGSASLSRFDSSAGVSTSYFSRAMSKLDEVLAMKGTKPLQALLFCCQYGVFASLQDTSTNVWHLLGRASRYCIELGLHRESSMRAPVTSDSAEESRHDFLHIEMKRRLFWCFYNLDRAVSVTLGRPVALRDEDIEVCLPSPFDDDLFDPENEDAECQRNIISHQIMGSSPFIQLIHIRNMTGKIMQTFYSIAPPKATSGQEKQAMRSDLAMELRSWRSNLPNMNELKRFNDKLPISTFLTPSWYEVLYHNAMILLFRPCPMFPHGEELSDLDTEDTVITNLLHSSRESVKSYTDLLRKRRLNYSWITLYSVFMAGLAYVYAIGRCLESAPIHSRSYKMPPYQEIIEVTRNCSNILVAICERWNEARTSCDIFDRLSNAVISAALKATSTTQAAQQIGVSSSVSSRTQMGRDSTVQSDLQRAATNSLPMTPPNTSGQYNVPDGGDETSNEIQDCFMGIQNAIFNDNSFSAPNEVMLGFGQDWFENSNSSTSTGNYNAQYFSSSRPSNFDGQGFPGFG